MPEALMAMTTSPGPGVGSGNSRSSSFRLPRKTMPFMSVSFALVDESQERPPRAEPPQVLAERGDDAAGAARRAARGVRRDDHARVGPERVTRRQRLGIGHVEPRAPDQSLVQRRQEVVAVHDRAPCHVDEDGGRAHPPEEVAGEEVVRRFGERQGNDDDVREPKHLVQAVGLPDRVDAGLWRDVLDVHRQDAHPEAERTPRHLAPEQDLGVHDLGALARRIRRLHEGGARARGLENPGVVRGGQGRNDQNRCIKDLHVGLKSSLKGAPVAIKIVLSPKLPAPLVEIARAIMPAGYELHVSEQGTAEFLDALEDAQYFVGFARTSLGSDFYRAAPRMKLVQLISAGYDRVDLEAARKAGIPVCNNGGTNAIAVAEHTMALMLAVTKKLVWQHNNVVAGKWRVGDFATTRLYELAGKTLGIVGLGNIGKKVARRALGFDMHVQYYDIVRLVEDAEDALGVRFVLFEELCRTADVVSLHVPLTERTRRMMGESQFASMKPSAILINTCRGPVVDEPALYRALTTGRLAGAGLDVMVDEPPPTNHPLFPLENVTITPHMAGPTWDTWQRCFRNAFDNVQRVAAGDKPLWVIPELSEPAS